MAIHNAAPFRDSIDVETRSQVVHVVRTSRTTIVNQPPGTDVTKSARAPARLFSRARSVLLSGEIRVIPRILYITNVTATQTIIMEPLLARRVH